MPLPKHEALLRLRAIELISYWEGRLVTTQLMTWFGISRQQASSDINRYNSEFNPGSLIHSPAVKGYVPTAGFQPVLSAGHINEYMALICDQSDQPVSEILEAHPSVTTVQLPDRAARPEVVRELIRTCRNAGSLKILYASMTNPQIHERVISPHTLVYTGFRWHVRAWCHKRQAFRDFLLSRIYRTPKSCDAQAPLSSTDSGWHDQVNLTLIPNELLSDAQKSLVERDFGMPEGRLQLTVRTALAHYTLQRYQAAITSEEAERVREHPLQLLPTDRAKLTPFLFSSDGE